jgi:hypothetical protein
MMECLLQHRFTVAVALYWVFSAAVSSLPEPGPNGNATYVWLYRFCHTMAGNLTTAFGNKISALKMFGLVLLFPLLFTISACAAQYVIHPGALTRTDSVAYDTLLIAETAINQARTAYQAGNLPKESKATLDALVQAYNVARESWLTYRDALQKDEPPDTYLNQLNKDIFNLTNVIRTLKEAQ